MAVCHVDRFPRVWDQRRVYVFLFVVWLMGASPGMAVDKVSGSSNKSIEALVSDIKNNLSYLLKAQFSSSIEEPGNPYQNPDNDFLDLPRYVEEIELRPDLSTTVDRLYLSVKPRLRAKWSYWTQGELSGEDDWDVDVFVNEWLARLSVLKNLYVSYGRENLQWGPSYFISPSNPFFKDNGQSNPEKEVAGMDFARIIWLPSSFCTVSLIANIDKGEQDLMGEDFHRAYAIKVDLTGYRKYFSLIGSYKESDRPRLGFFGGWTATDALMIYGEGSVSQGTGALYPVKVRDTYLGPTIRMMDIKDDETALESMLLGGISYTLECGPTLTVEYVFNSAGYDDEQAQLFFKLQHQAASVFSTSRNLSELALSSTFHNGLRLLRKNYIMFQYQHVRIRDQLDLILRFLYNADDHSSRFNPIVEYDLDNRFQLFLVGSQNFGPKDSETRWLFDFLWMAGLNFTY